MSKVEGFRKTVGVPGNMPYNQESLKRMGHGIGIVFGGKDKTSRARQKQLREMGNRLENGTATPEDIAHFLDHPDEVLNGGDSTPKPNVIIPKVSPFANGEQK